MPSKTEVKTQRRRRNTDMSGRNRRLSVNDAALDRENFTYRFINDDGSRVFDLTQNDDWDIVENDNVKADSNSTDGKVSAYAGTDKRGSTVNTILVRKPKDLADEDEAAKRARNDEIIGSIKAGNVPGSGADEQSYVPSGGISMNAQN